MPITDKNGQVLSTRQVLHKGKTRLKTILLELWTGFLWWGVGFLPFHSLRRFFYRLSGMKIGPPIDHSHDGQDLSAGWD